MSRTVVHDFCAECHLNISQCDLGGCVGCPVCGSIETYEKKFVINESYEGSVCSECGRWKRVCGDIKSTELEDGQ